MGLHSVMRFYIFVSVHFCTSHYLRTTFVVYVADLPIFLYVCDISSQGHNYPIVVSHVSFCFVEPIGSILFPQAIVLMLTLSHTTMWCCLMRSLSGIDFMLLIKLMKLLR